MYLGLGFVVKVPMVLGDADQQKRHVQQHEQHADDPQRHVLQHPLHPQTRLAAWRTGKNKVHEQPTTFSLFFFLVFSFQGQRAPAARHALVVVGVDVEPGQREHIGHLAGASVGKEDAEEVSRERGWCSAGAHLHTHVGIRGGGHVQQWLQRKVKERKRK